MASKHFYLSEHKGPICDFCGRPGPTWAFDGPDPMAGAHGKFVVLGNNSWASCDECALLVEQNNVMALVKRCVREIGELPADILSFTLTIYFTKTLNTLGKKRRPNERELKSRGGMNIVEDPNERASQVAVEDSQ